MVVSDYQIKVKGEEMTKSLIFCLAVVVLLAGCLAALVVVIRQMQKLQAELIERIEELSEMNAKLRAGRHDSLNQMQIVYGMLELGEYDELKDFLEPVYQDLLKTGKALKTSIPAVNALLMAKSAEAESLHIDFYLEVKSNLKEMPMSDWELCRVLGNLLDNAFRAVKDEAKSTDGLAERNKVYVDITEAKDCYLLTVADSGKGIPDSIRGRLFMQGFTTKKEPGHGMGLYIVSRLVAKYKGSIEYQNANGRTEFIVSLPK